MQINIPLLWRGWKPSIQSEQIIGRPLMYEIHHDPYLSCTLSSSGPFAALHKSPRSLDPFYLRWTQTHHSRKSSTSFYFLRGIHTSLSDINIALSPEYTLTDSPKGINYEVSLSQRETVAHVCEIWRSAFWLQGAWKVAARNEDHGDCGRKKAEKWHR